MASAVESAVLQVLVKRLASLFFDNYGLTWDVTKEVENMRRTLLMIQDVLEDAEQQQLEKKAVENWLRQLKDVACDAEDILDEVATKDLGVERKFQEIVSTPSRLLFQQIAGRKIKEIRHRLDELAEQGSKFHLKRGAHDSKIRCRQQTDSFVIESEVYGREEDKEVVLKLLINAGEDEEEFFVIPIVSMGGLGKTTLTQLVYNDARVEEHFDIRIWVFVSDHFDVRRVIKAIIESITDSTCDLQDMDLLQRRLRKELGGRKFLLVLDDVWEENPEKWDQLNNFLRGGGSKGSKIIVTTRSKKVASIMGTLDAYELTTLSEDDCWLVFKQQAFGRRRQEKPNLVILGKEIVKKCGGVPLVAKALGSLMYFKRDEREWQLVKDKELLNLLRQEDNILPTLRLSYYHLPSHLKQCFAYCSIFPKGHIINKKKLIQLWMAQGFISPTPLSQGSKQMDEDTGAEYFNNLLWRSFFHDAKKDEDGNTLECKMHDLMHDLAQSVAGDESSIVKVDSKEVIIQDRCRHLSLVCDSKEMVSKLPTALNKAKNLRTLLFLLPHNRPCPGNMSILFLHLRVLDLSGMPSLPKELLVSIGNLKQLRYLDLSWTRIQSLPDSITTLYNLQTLRLLGCGLVKLPNDLREMTSLRHLEIDRFYSLTSMPSKMGDLKFLQSLPIFIVGKDSGYGIRELQYQNLVGQLTIQNLENVRGASEAEEAELKEKSNLQMLEFSWGDNIHDDELRDLNAEKTLDGLQPHRNLKRLEMKHYPGIRFPQWLGLLQNLVNILLYNCKKCEQLPPLGKLPSLKVLWIVGMDAVACIGNHFYGDDETIVGFPSLKEFMLREMINLEEWSARFNGRQVFPLLERLHVYKCPKLKTISAEPSGFPRLEGLTIENCLKLTTISAEPSGFPHLQRLTIFNCPELTTISAEPSGFPRLELLTVYNCLELTTILDEWFLYPSLERLDVCNCPKLTTISKEPSSFPRLLHLDVQGCPVLTKIPSLQSVKELSLWDGSGLLLHSVAQLTSLSSLDIASFEEVESLPDGMLRNLTQLSSLSIIDIPKLESLSVELGNLAALEKLNIIHCGRLAALPNELQNLTSLRRLCISHCNGLTSLQLQGLTSLQSLSIQQCPSLTSLIGGLQDLTSLDYLQIDKCPELTSFPVLGMQHIASFSISSSCDKLTCFPEGLKHATMLRQLRIWNWPSLTALPEWIANLSSLQRLVIHECDNLVSWPSGFQHLTYLDIGSCNKLSCLPERLKHATNLRELKISNCPSLTSRPRKWIANLSSLRSFEVDGCAN